MYRYRRPVDEWIVYNIAEFKTPTLVAYRHGAMEKIVEEQKWQRLKKLAKLSEK